MNAFLNYYGADWVAMALSLSAVYLLGNRARIGFLVFAMANTVWVFLDFFGWIALASPLAILPFL